MVKEIERKFLVVKDDWRSGCDGGTSIRQAYLVALDDRSVRVRISASARAKLTMKFGRAALVRDEYEYDIPLADAEELFSQALGHIIEKTRYRLPSGPFTWEIDVFRGGLSGLTIAEIELGHEDDAPELPAWLGREVTGDAAYTNQNLARFGLPQGALA